MRKGYIGIVALVIAAIVIAGGFILFKNKGQVVTSVQTTLSSKEEMKKDEEKMMGVGYILKGGKLLREEGEKMIAETQDATLKDGTTVTLAGLVRKKDGSTVRLEEGGSIWEPDGTIMTATEAAKAMEKEKSFSGKVLAGKSSPYLIFNKADYDKALKSGKVVFLDFYANWCPICRAEEPNLKAGFDSLKSDKVVGFRVNWQDNDTTEDMKKLAQEMGINHQTTKVILKDGKKVFGPEIVDLDKDTFLQQINAVL